MVCIPNSEHGQRPILSCCLACHSDRPWEINTHSSNVELMTELEQHTHTHTQGSEFTASRFYTISNSSWMIKKVIQLFVTLLLINLSCHPIVCHPCSICSFSSKWQAKGQAEQLRHPQMFQCTAAFLLLGCLSLPHFTHQTEVGANQMHTTTRFVTEWIRGNGRQQKQQGANLLHL